jgi:hypothetical protein
MKRVVCNNGWVMVFDYIISKPNERETVGINRYEIVRLFSELEMKKVYRLILAPPILRRLPFHLMWLALFLETVIPFLCTHRLYLIRKTTDGQ